MRRFQYGRMFDEGKQQIVSSEFDSPQRRRHRRVRPHSEGINAHQIEEHAKSTRNLALRSTLLCPTVRQADSWRARRPHDASSVLDWHPGGFGGSDEIVATRGTVERVS